MHDSLYETVHRPWPLPDTAWVLSQSWLELGFFHYRVSPELIAAKLPAAVELETFGGDAWLGVVPFVLANLAPRLVGSLIRLPRFTELNLRTYVTCNGKPGVWFFSLDAESLPVVTMGRRLFGLAYHRAKMRHVNQAGWCEVSSSRSVGGYAFEGRYRPTGPVSVPTPGSFEHWLVERYCLYSLHPKHGLLRLEVHHKPWPLQACECEIKVNQTFAASGLEQAVGDPCRPDVCHFSSGVDVVSFRAHDPLAAKG